MKFSDAISSIWPRWRSSSRSISPAISGSTSASPAERSVSSETSARAIGRSLGIGIARPAAPCIRGQPTAWRTRSSASTRGPAPSRRIFGSRSVRSMTVEGTPGSSPPSIAAAACSRSSAGHLREPASLPLPVDVRARGHDDAHPAENLARALPERPVPVCRRPPAACRRATGSAWRGSGARACTGPAGAHERRRPPVRAAPARRRGCRRDPRPSTRRAWSRGAA